MDKQKTILDETRINQSNLASQNIKGPNLPKQPNAFISWISGVAVVILPLLFFFFLVRRTIDIARDPATSWWLDLCVLVGAFLLLLPKVWGKQTRKIVEVTIFVAALAVFVTKFIITGIPHS